MNGSRPRPVNLNDAGATLVELLVYLVIASVVLASVYGLMINQSRAYADQREGMDARETVRGAAALLTSELRQLSAAGGDLYSIQPTSLALRSVLGSGIVCGLSADKTVFGLWQATGKIYQTADDSALVFAAGEQDVSDDTWRAFDIIDVQPGGSAPVPSCAWPTSPTTESVVTGTGDTTGISVGGGFRAFRRIEYGLFEDAGRWWLGRKIGSGAWERLTGPLRSPTDGGLSYSYFDAGGNVTADPAAVRTVEIVIRAESFGKARRYGGSAPPTERQDSIRTRVFLRG